MKTTKEIENEYKITRQTIHNWINEGLINSPNKERNGSWIWEYENINELKSVFQLKAQRKNNISLNKKFEPFNIENRRYLGGKQKLLPFINDVVSENTSGIKSVADVFGGTGVVANMFREQGKKVILNDILLSNYHSYQTWFGNDDVDIIKISQIIYELNKLRPKQDNYVSVNFGDKYFSLSNSRKIGEIREKIESYKNLNNREYSILITSLVYAMDKVANTVGHYDAYRKKLDSLQPMVLRMPEINSNKDNQIFREDANKLVGKIKADLVYIDTPYNSRQYCDTYHLLENIVEWNKPEVTGVAMKMVDRSKIKSDYSTSKAPKTFENLIMNIKSKYILVSYNNMEKKGNGRSNAKISQDEIIRALEKRGNVSVFSQDFKVFSTGKTNIDNHKELLYLCEASDFE